MKKSLLRFLVVLHRSANAPSCKLSKLCLIVLQLTHQRCPQPQLLHVVCIVEVFDELFEVVKRSDSVGEFEIGIEDCCHGLFHEVCI